MRNNLFCTLTAVLVAFMGVSCLSTSGLDMQQGDHIDVATIVDGSYNTPYYVEFDNGEKASVASNRVGSSITFPTKPEILKGEVRKIVEYYLDGTPLEGFEKSITITNMFNIPTDIVKLLDTVNATEFDDPMNITAAGYAKNRNYLTMQLLLYKSAVLDYKHEFFLAYNPSKKGAYEDMYGSAEGDARYYLWFELYHDAGVDTTVSDLAETFLSVKLDPEVIGTDDLSNFKGIKIIYRDLDTRKPKIHTINF